MLSKLMGNSSVINTSELIGDYLSEGEGVLSAFKVWRDEIIITNFGIYLADAQGITGKKKNIKYYAKEELVGLIFDNNYGIARDCKLTLITKSSGNLLIEIKKSDSGVVVDLVKIIKELINEKWD